MDEEKIKIEFWEDKNGFKPVKDFFGKLPKIYISKITKRLEFATGFNFNDLLNYGDVLSMVTGCSNIKPRPYEFKIKISLPVRIICYRKNNNTLVFVEAIKDSFSNKNKFKRILEIYKNRIC